MIRIIILLFIANFCNGVSSDSDDCISKALELLSGKDSNVATTTEVPTTIFANNGDSNYATNSMEKPTRTPIFTNNVDSVHNFQRTYALLKKYYENENQKLRSENDLLRSKLSTSSNANTFQTPNLQQMLYEKEIQKLLNENDLLRSKLTSISSSDGNTFQKTNLLQELYENEIQKLQKENDLLRVHSSPIHTTQTCCTCNVSDQRSSNNECCNLESSVFLQTLDEKLSNITEYILAQPKRTDSSTTPVPATSTTPLTSTSTTPIPRTSTTSIPVTTTPIPPGQARAPANMVGYRGYHHFQTFTFTVTGSVSGSVWGSNYYSDVSDLATAAVHAGVAKNNITSTIRVEIQPGGVVPPGTTRNGVTSLNAPEWVMSQDYQWVTATVHDAFPLGAVHAGHDTDGSQIFLGRSFLQGDQLPCKIIPNKQAAYVSYNGTEYFVDNYDVLCGDGFDWIPSANGEIPEGAFQVGSSKSGEPLFAGRAEFHGSLTPGKVHQSHGCLYIPFGGGEHSIQTYEVLVRISPSSDTPPPTKDDCCCCCVQ